MKMGSRKYRRDTPLPASISVFFLKYGNGRDGMGFSPSIFILKFKGVN
jgi:hypothetical protein